MLNYVINPYDSSTLTTILHQRGINIRYIGKIFYNLQSIEENIKTDSSFSIIRIKYLKVLKKY